MPGHQTYRPANEAVDGSPPLYHSVVSKDEEPDLAYEKPQQQKSLWQKFRGLFHRSNQANSQTRAQLPDEAPPMYKLQPPDSAPPKTNPPPAPALPPVDDSAYATHRWELWAPRVSSSLQKGVKPDLSRFQYSIQGFHLPPTHHNTETCLRAPWVVSMHFFTHDLHARLLPRQRKPHQAAVAGTQPTNNIHPAADGTLLAVPWLALLDKCFVDKIDVTWHPMDSTQRRFQRKLKVGYGHRKMTKWVVVLNVYHEDVEWLAGLSYAEIAALVTVESMVSVWGRVRPAETVVDQPCEMEKTFYYRLDKPLWRLPSKSEYVDEPELAQLLDAHWGRFIRQGRKGDW